MYCPQCGKQSINNTPICANCGSPLVSSPGKKKPISGARKLIYILLAITIISILWILLDNYNPEAIAEMKRTKIDDYRISIVDTEVVKRTHDNADILVVTYAFTNNSDRSVSFMYTLSDTLFQNGVEIESSSSWGLEGVYNSDNKSKEIQPGVTLNVQNAYELSDTTTTVDVEITKWIDTNNGPRLTFSIPLAG